MDPPALRQRISVWRIVAELVYLCVWMFFLYRALEQAGWQRILFHWVLIIVLTQNVGWLGLPLGIAIDALLANIMDA